MVSIARKNLFHEKTRLLISVGGVGLSILLILVLGGIYYGISELATSYIRNTDADLFVVQEGVTDMFHTSSFLPESIEGNISNINGVTRVSRLIGRALSINLSGGHATIYVIGYNTTTEVGGPWNVVEGSSKPEEGEVIIDRVFAAKNRLGIGDSLVISDYRFTVVGIAEGANMMIYQYAFIPLEDAARALNSQGFVNFFLVSIDGNANEISETIRNEIFGVDAIPHETFMNENKKLIADSFLPIIAVIVVIGFLTGVTIIGLTTYTATIEKTKEYGILKAIGASNLDLYKIIFQQSLISALIGFGLGAMLSFATTFVAGELVPEFSILITNELMVEVLLSACAMSLAASYLPIRRISRIDPLIVFKS